jgi:poly(A) polymerase
MKLAPDWLRDSEVQAFCAACVRREIPIRFVGGAVRDTLLLREVADIDVATPIPVAEVMARLGAEGFTVVPTGIAHGTVSIVMKTRQFEVTTLRRDVATDGRHAIIAPTEAWEEDALRRDFTMNALYLSPDGVLFDYTHGQDDALAGRVRFIGDATTRIREDGLRILRFFRFLASHGEPPADEDALAACRANADMLNIISGERIAAEMKKLLAAHNPVYALRQMEAACVTVQIFPVSIRIPVFTRLMMIEHTAGLRASIWARCAALLAATRDSGEQIAQEVATRWRLSNKEKKQLALLLTTPRLNATDAPYCHTRMIRLHGVALYQDLLLLSAAEGGAFDLAPWCALAAAFVPPIFPVSAADVMARGVPKNAALGDALARLMDLWEESDYQLSRDALLAQLGAE